MTRHCKAKNTIKTLQSASTSHRGIHSGCHPSMVLHGHPSSGASSCCMAKSRKPPCKNNLARFLSDLTLCMTVGGSIWTQVFSKALPARAICHRMQLVSRIPAKILPLERGLNNSISPRNRGTGRRCRRRAAAAPRPASAAPGAAPPAVPEKSPAPPAAVPLVDWFVSADDLVTPEPYKTTGHAEYPGTPVHARLQQHRTAKAAAALVWRLPCSCQSSYTLRNDYQVSLHAGQKARRQPEARMHLLADGAAQ